MVQAIQKRYLKQLKAEDPAKYEQIMAEREQYARDNEKTPGQLEALKNKYKHQLRNNRSLK